MSGHKRATVSIGQEEYDRLREAEIRMRSLPDISDAVSQVINQQSEQAIRQQLSDAQRRVDAYEQVVGRMSDQIASLEASNHQRLQDLEAAMAAEAQRHTGALWDHFEQLLSDNNRYHQTAMDANRKCLEEQIIALADEYQTVAEAIESSEAAAANWLNDAEQLFTYLQETYACEQFCPGQLARLELLLKQALQNYQSGYFEASLPISQQALIDLSDLHIELERAESEWQTLRLSVLEALSYIIELASNSQVVDAIDLEGNPLSFQVYVDDWMEGRLRRWTSELVDFKQEIVDGQVLLDTETLQRLLTVDFPAWKQDLETMVLDARTLSLNSQLRINIADLVIQALVDQGFTLNPDEDASYEAGNASLSYNVRLHNREGSEVFVNVLPVENGFGENELHLQSRDAEKRTEHELLQRWKEVSRSLRYYGLEVSGFEQVPEQGARRGSIRQRLAGAARKIKAGANIGKPEEVNEYRTDP